LASLKKAGHHAKPPLPIQVIDGQISEGNAFHSRAISVGLADNPSPVAHSPGLTHVNVGVAAKVLHSLH
jgi:hypothetical protein